MYILRITFKSIKILNKLKDNITKLKKKYNFKNIEIGGIYKTKNKNKIFTLLKSPHVNKKSREHFIYKNYHQKIDFKFNNYLLLLNFLIILKKILIKNYLINIKIIKKKKCL